MNHHAAYVRIVQSAFLISFRRFSSKRDLRYLVWWDASPMRNICKASTFSPFGSHKRNALKYVRWLNCLGGLAVWVLKRTIRGRTLKTNFRKAKKRKWGTNEENYRRQGRNGPNLMRIGWDGFKIRNSFKYKEKITVWAWPKHSYWGDRIRRSCSCKSS